MGKINFPQDFLWGTCTASYQIEGAHNEDGKGESIWDRFAHTPGNIEDGYVGDIACDHYHRYQEDVAHMKKMNNRAYRFSISWPRIFPGGQGKINEKGLDFYKKLIDELKSNDIIPVATIYHWDLPQHLQFLGGWANNDTVKYYTEYARTLFQELGDDVPYWITFNEPWCISFLSNMIGEHAPGKKDTRMALEVAHNLHIAHGRAVEAFKQEKISSEIGITLNLYPVEGVDEQEKTNKAVQLMDQHKNRWFLDPVFFGKYPEKLYKIYQSHFGDFTAEHADIKEAQQDIDFLGVNYYTRTVVKFDPNHILKSEAVNPKGSKYTDMGWEEYPQGLYKLLKRVDQDYGPVPLYITENGAAYKEKVEKDGAVHDPDRINYLKEHFQAAFQAIEEGVPLKGYFVWTLMDNFEWAFGYNKKFGLIYTDFDNNQKRIWKDSAYWFKKVIAENGFIVE